MLNQRNLFHALIATQNDPSSPALVRTASSTDREKRLIRPSKLECERNRRRKVFAM